MSKNGIRDARTLGVPKMLLLGFQHMFAMFGATVLVPVLTGLPVAATLLFAGLGTLLFHFLSKGKVPAFLGSSFAFIGGYARSARCSKMPPAMNWIPYACVGVMSAPACSTSCWRRCSARSAPAASCGSSRRSSPARSSSALDMTLANSAINNCAANWWIAHSGRRDRRRLQHLGQGHDQDHPDPAGRGRLLCGRRDVRTGGLLRGARRGVDRLPVRVEDTVFSLFNGCDGGLLVSSIAIMMPIALATMVEHIGDMCAISSTVGENYVADPGLHRTLLGDGLATTLAALFGAPANTTYGENTGVLALTKVYDPRVIRIAAVLAILFAFCPKFEALIAAMPTATIGGVSLILYGMISAVGVRNVVENQVDFTKSRNVIIAALILGLSLGINFSSASGCDTAAGVNGAISFTISWAP